MIRNYEVHLNRSYNIPYIAIQAGAKSKLMDSHLTTNFANKQCIDCIKGRPGYTYGENGGTV